MSVLVAGVLGAGFGLGVVLVARALSGRSVLPRRPVPRPGPSALSGRGGALAGAGLVGGLVLAMATGWFVAALAPIGIALASSRLLTGGAARRAEMARTEAIATWTELVRGGIAAGAGLQEAIRVTQDRAPLPIRREVRLLVERAHQRGLVDALVAFGQDLAHPAADFVVSALTISARMEAGDLTERLARLVQMMRQSVEMQDRVEVDRAEVRMSTRIILGAAVAAFLVLGAFNRGHLDVYGLRQGQAALLVVGALVVVAGRMLLHLAEIPLPERFTARRPEAER